MVHWQHVLSLWLVGYRIDRGERGHGPKGVHRYDWVALA